MQNTSLNFFKFRRFHTFILVVMPVVASYGRSSKMGYAFTPIIEHYYQQFNGANPLRAQQYNKLVINFTAFYTNRRFITVFTKAITSPYSEPD